MKIVIAYASCGGGHRKAAEALAHHLKATFPSAELTIVDILSYTNRAVAFFYSRGYDLLVNRFLLLWGFLFWLTSLKSLRPHIAKAHALSNAGSASRFSAFLCREPPDVIFATHFFPLQLAASLKEKNKISSRVICLITDLGVHPFWLWPGIDMFGVATPYTRELLIGEGIPQENIRVTGIPTSPVFLAASPRRACRERLALKDMFSVLVVAGSFGIGPLAEITASLCRDMQVLVVCARNRKLYARLLQADYKHTKVFGFINTIHELMDAADVIITKPGGLTIAEILVKELPCVFIRPIPGQETENVFVLAHYGIGRLARNTREVAEIVQGYRANPEQLKVAREAMRTLKREFNVRELL